MIADELRLDEYKSLRGEIYSLVAETRKLEILAVGGVAAIWAWFVTSNVSASTAWFAPTLLPLLGALRAYALFRRIAEIATYLRTFEKSVNWSGWETHFAEKVKSRLSFTAVVFWLTLLLATFVAPHVLPQVCSAVAEKNQATHPSSSRATPRRCQAQCAAQLEHRTQTFGA